MGNFFHCEPPLSQVLDDPLTQALMESDGVDPRELDNLISEVRRRMAEAARMRKASPLCC